MLKWAAWGGFVWLLVGCEDPFVYAIIAWVGLDFLVLQNEWPGLGPASAPADTEGQGLNSTLLRFPDGQRLTR